MDSKMPEMVSVGSDDTDSVDPVDTSSVAEKTYKCHKCQKRYPARSFPKDKSRRSGLASKCKACSRSALKLLNAGQHQASAFIESVVDLPEGDLDLPPDLAWVYHHPAMLRAVRSTGDKSVLLKADDMAGAPSRGAVFLLQRYVNHPKEFTDTILHYAKKVGPQASEGDGFVDDGRNIEDIDEMINQLAPPPETTRSAQRTSVDAGVNYSRVEVP